MLERILEASKLDPEVGNKSMDIFVEDYLNGKFEWEAYKNEGTASVLSRVINRNPNLLPIVVKAFFRYISPSLDALTHTKGSVAASLDDRQTNWLMRSLLAAQLKKMPEDLQNSPEAIGAKTVALNFIKRVYQDADPSFWDNGDGRPESYSAENSRLHRVVWRTGDLILCLQKEGGRIPLWDELWDSKYIAARNAVVWLGMGGGSHQLLVDRIPTLIEPASMSAAANYGLIVEDLFYFTYKALGEEQATLMLSSHLNSLRERVSTGQSPQDITGWNRLAECSDIAVEILPNFPTLIPIET